MTNGSRALTLRLVFATLAPAATTPAVVHSPAEMCAWGRDAFAELRARGVEEPWHATLEVQSPRDGAWLHPVVKHRPALVRLPPRWDDYRGERYDAMWRERFGWCVDAVDADGRRGAMP